MLNKSPKLLLVSERKQRMRVLKSALSSLGGLEIVYSGYDAIQFLALESYDVILIDFDLSLMSGQETLLRIRREDTRVPVIVIPRDAQFVRDVAEGIELGAQMFLRVQMSADTIRQITESVLHLGPIPGKVAQIRMALQSLHHVNNLVGSSQEMFEVYRRLEKIVDSNVSVLIRGESGTGKELVARLVHSMSPRAKKNFIALNCAAIPENLLESELFGHEKGAFTGAASQRIGKFELADEGTLFLDEIGDMSPVLQAKLLRVLEHGTFERVGGNTTLKTNVRIISATNKNLSEAIIKGRFREDLFYRLNVFSVNLPPLRSRVSDVVLLAIYFIHKFNSKNNRDIQQVSDSVFRILQSYPWPGNIRELQNVMEQTILLAENNHIAPNDLPGWIRASNGNTGFGEHSGLTGIQLAFENTGQIYSLEDIESAAIQKAVELTGGNISRAADELGVSRVTLYRKMEKYRIDLKES